MLIGTMEHWSKWLLLRESDHYFFGPVSNFSDNFYISRMADDIIDIHTNSNVLGKRGLS